MKNLGSWIKSVRVENGLDSLTFSKNLNISPSKLSKIETGKQTVDGEILLTVMEKFNRYPNKKNELNPLILNNEIHKSEAAEVLAILTQIMHELPERREQPFKNNPLKELLVDQLPDLIHSAFSLPPETFKITGSIGKGQFAEVPWLCVFISDITKTATKGYYIVFLLSADGQYCYMSLNQGWTFYKEKYGTKLARKKIQVAASYFVEELTSITSEWITGPLTLNGRGTLARGYEIGNICAKQYHIDGMPTVEQLVEDFQYLLGLYHEINVLKGNRSVDEFTETLLLQEDHEYIEDEVGFNASVLEVISKTTNEPLIGLKKGPELARKPVISRNGKSKYTRRAKIAAQALKLADFQCEIDPTHQTFTNKVTNMHYVEAHHLIHMSAQSDFKYELDCVQNIVALCPTCHRLLHHGTDKDKEQQIELLHTKRADRLAAAKIYLPLVELKKMYGVE